MLDYRTDEENHRVCTGGCPESCNGTYPCCVFISSEEDMDSETSVEDMVILREGLLDCLVSPDDRDKRVRVECLVERGLMRSTISYSLADFFTYRITSAGRQLLLEEEDKI